MDDSLRLMHLMCSKMCHDLAAPLGAVSMGLEMLDGQPSSDVRDIISSSAQATVNKLELFRCLTGYASHPNKPDMIEAERLLSQFWTDGKVRLNISQDIREINGPQARLLVALIMLAGEGLIRGGEVTVTTPDTILAQGEGARLHEDVIQVLSGELPLAEQSSRTILAYFAGLMACSHNKHIQPQQQDGIIKIDILPLS